MISLNLSCSTAQKSDLVSTEIPFSVAAPVSVAPEYEILQQCDKTLNSCDLTVHKKNDEIKKQTDLLTQQAKVIADAKVKADSPLRNPIVWAAVGTAAVGIGGPIAIPFVIVGAVLVGVFLK